MVAYFEGYWHLETIVHLLTDNPALGLPTFNLPALATCTPSKWCARHCYARRGNFLYSGIRASHARRLGETQDLATWIDRMSAEVYLAGANGFPAVRVHSSGDLYSPDYFRAWLEVASNVPNVPIFGFTKAWRADWEGVLVEALDVPSFHLRLSADPSTIDPRLLGLGLPCAYVDGAPGSGVPNCLKQTSGIKCRDCRECWESSGDVTFLPH